MKVGYILLGSVAATLMSVPVAAQTPVLGNIEAPYPALQSPVHIAGGSYGPGAVSYGSVGTPLQLYGSNFGVSGSVLFPGTQRGTTTPGTVTFWSATMVFVNVPAGATSGLVLVTTGGKSSNVLPFIVTPGAYSGSCPASPPQNQLEITTTSLPNGTVGQAYSTTLSRTGGTAPFTWSTSGNSLPSGLSLSSAGVLSGTPTAASGTVSVTFSVVDANSQSADAVLDVSVDSQTLTAGTVYSYSALYDGAGNVTSYADKIMGSWGFAYDTLNRLSSAVPGAGAPGTYAAQNICFAYDAFGNRTAQDMQSSACPAQESSVSPAISYTANNQLPTGIYTYDADGDVSADVGHTYLFDGDGRICAVNSTAVPGTTAMTGYIYNAEGVRVAKGTITSMSCDPSVNGFQLTGSYVLGPSSEELTTLDGSGNWQRTNVYGAGRLTATYDVAGLHFHFSDPLGTRRMQASYLGVAELDCQGLPFGDGLNCYTDPNAPPSADDSNPLHFTGKERDQESGNDYFGARYYGSSMGRFLNPDPVIITPERLTNPQQLNLYAYVANNPLRFIDPTGEILQCVGDDKSRSQCFSDLEQIAGDAANRLSMDAKTGVVSFDTKDLDMSKNEGASLVDNLVGSKNTYDFSVGPTIMTDKGPVRIDKISVDLANLPTFGDQPKSGNPPAGVSDILGLYLNNPNITRVSNTNLKVAPEWTVAFHELAEAYAKIDGGMGGSYAAGHNAALQREMELRDQRPYLKEYNTGAGGPANSPNPQGGIIIKK